MDMQFLMALQEIRSPHWDAVFQMITYLAEETLLVGALCLIYWCANKRLAIRMIFTFFVVGMMAQALKITFCVPRPWMRDALLIPVESAREAASGFSFPSGHVASAVAVYGSLAMYYRKRWLSLICAAIVLLVAFSRMYLGVHTPQDVAVSLLIGSGLLLAAGKLFEWMERDDGAGQTVFWFGIAISLALIAYAQIKPYPNMPGVAELALDSFKIGGVALGLFLGWRFEQTRIRFDVPAPRSEQVLKYVIGMALVGALMLIKQPAEWIGPRPWALVKYLLVGYSVLALWPQLFSRWQAARGKACASSEDAV